MQKTLCKFYVPWGAQRSFVRLCSMELRPSQLSKLKPLISDRALVLKAQPHSVYTTKSGGLCFSSTIFTTQRYYSDAIPTVVHGEQTILLGKAIGDLICYSISADNVPKDELRRRLQGGVFKMPSTVPFLRRLSKLIAASALELLAPHKK